MVKNPGKVFEDEIKKSCKEEGIYIYRVKDTAQSYNQYAAKFTTKNPCDFFIYKMPILLLAECKHTKNGSMSIQRSKSESDDKMIKFHQIEALTEASKFDGVEAGFFLSFLNEKTQVETTYYLSIDKFNIFLNNNDKKSINQIDVIKLNPIIIRQEQMRKNYRFYIGELFDNIEKRRDSDAEEDI